MKRTPKRIFEPFPDATDAITFAFAVNEDSLLHPAQDKFYIDQDTFNEGISPILELGIDKEVIKHTYDLDFEKIFVAVTYRNPDAKHYFPIKSWHLDSIPKNRQNLTHLNGLKFFAYNHHIFSILLYLDEAVDKRPRQPHRRGAVLGRRDIVVAREQSAQTFPIRPKSPDDFKKEGLPPEALWYVKFIQSEIDVDKPIDSVLEVWINSDVRQRLNRALTSSRSGHILATNITSEIFSTIALEVFRNAVGPPVEEVSLLKTLCDEFEKHTDLGFDSLTQMAVENGANQIFRAYGQMICGVHKDIMVYG